MHEPEREECQREKVQPEEAKHDAKEGCKERETFLAMKSVPGRGRPTIIAFKALVNPTLYPGS